MRTAGKIVLGTALGAALAASSPTNAQTCNGTHPLLPDGRVNAALSSSTAADHVNYFFRGKPGRSYFIDVRGLNRDYAAGNFSVNASVGTSCPTTNGTGVRVTSTIEPTGSGFGAASLTIQVAIDSYVYVRAGWTSGSAVPMEATLVDTTLFSPTWSTVTTYDTYYSFQNTTNALCTATLTQSDTTGAVAATATLPIPAGTTAAANTVSLGTPRNKTGTATLTHDCPAGGILVQMAVANFTSTPAYIQAINFVPVRNLH